MTGFWPILLVGTTTALILALGFIAVILQHERVKNRLQKEMLSVAAEGEKRYSDLFNSVTDIVYEHSLPGGTILQINQAIERILGYKTEEVLGKSVAQLMRPGQRTGVEKYIENLLTSGERAEAVVPIVKKSSGELVLLEYRSIPITSDGIKGSVRGIARDVTSQKRNEYTIRKSRKKVENLLSEAEIAKKNLEDVSRQLINIQEEERKRISRELHDEVSQLIVAVNIDLELARKIVPKDNTAVLDKLADMEQLLSQVMDQIHHFLRELRPRVLDELGLLPALRQLVFPFTDRTGIQVSLDSEDDDSIEKLSGEQKTALFRVVQESLTNIAKHAEAQNASVHLSCDEDYVLCEIADDGRGIGNQGNSSSKISGAGFGILGMRERVKLVSGTFTIGPNRTKGTRIQVRIPMGC